MSDRQKLTEKVARDRFEFFRGTNICSIDPQYIQNEVRAFLSGDSRSSHELAPLYDQCNSQIGGRRGRFKKLPFALYWAFLKFDQEREIFLYIREKLKLAPPPLVRGRKGKKINELMDLFSEWVEWIEPITIDRYAKKGTLEQAMIDRILNPEMLRLREKDRQMRNLEKDLDGMECDIPPLKLEGAFSDLMAMDPKDRALIKKSVKHIRQENKFAIKLFEFLKQKKLAGEDWVSQRDIQRRFTKTSSALRPVLEDLASERAIILDNQEKRISLNSYDPKDHRKFVWLAASSWPRLPFEPFLETRKIYQVGDFRSYVVEEWVRTGAARLKKS